VTYHWNFGAGRAPGSITLRSVNAPFAFVRTYPATGQPGSNNVPNVNWVASLDAVLAPGTYEIDDSDPGSWSQNGQSGGVGFTIVRGATLSAGLIVGGPPPVPPPAPHSGPAPITPPVTVGCGNPGYRLAMTPCVGPWASTVITMVVVRALPTPITSAEFKYYDSGIGLPSATPVPIFTTPTLVSGNGTALGSVYTITPPQLHGLCVAGQYSRWGLFPLHADGSGEGEIGLFRIAGCP
jgi:hypothetical protein